MKTAIINASVQSDSLSNQTFDIVRAELAGRNAEIETFILRDMNIAHCVGCFGCWVKSPGVCVQNDDSKLIAHAVVNSDLLVMVTPVVFGCYSPLLKKAAERLTPILSPFFMKMNGEMHHKKRYKQYPSLLAVGVMEKPDTESAEIFEDLVHRNAENLHSPRWTAGIVGDQGVKMLDSQIAELIGRMEAA